MRIKCKSFIFLIFTSNLIKLTLHTFGDSTIPANSSKDIHLVMFCCNAHRGIAARDDPYKIGIITANPDLQTVCNILDSKPTIDPADFGTIQTIIWKITDNGGFGQADIDLLYAM